MRILLLSILLSGGPVEIAAQSPAVSGVAVQGAFFALSVADLKASADWYGNAFGLKVVLDEQSNGAAVIVLEGGGLIVELIRQPDARPLQQVAPAVTSPMSVHGFVKAGFIVNDFEGTLSRLRERHVEIAYGPFPARGNQRANVLLKDNAGNLIQVFGR